jgi:hypothetical protein
MVVANPGNPSYLKSRIRRIIVQSQTSHEHESLSPYEKITVKVKGLVVWLKCRTLPYKHKLGV